MKSSKFLEYLTSIIIIVAIAPVSVALIPFNPYYALVTAIGAFVGLIIVWRKARRELPKT